MSVRYRVYLTPQVTKGTYGTEIEISDRVTLSGLNKMRKSLDSSDFDIGAYYYGDINLTGANDDGFFSEDDDRSVFPGGRDLSKVRVSFDESGTETTLFKGLINEESTRLNIVTNSIQMRVLSQDSVIRTAKVNPAVIPNGVSASSAMLTILNQAHITNILGVDAGNINVPYDPNIDDGSQYDNLSVRDVLNELLLISNSVMFIDSNDDIIIRSRNENANPIRYLYGPFDMNGRENIVAVKKFNNGKHRMVNSVKVNNSEVNDGDLINTFGFKQKKIDVDSITAQATEEAIAQVILDEFKAPKIELELTVKTELAKGYDLQDRVSVNYPKRYATDKRFLPIVGINAIDQENSPLPYVYGSASIDPGLGFKIISIDHSAKNFTTDIKLRQIGITLSDGLL